MTSAKTDAKPQKAMYSFGYESKARALNGFGDMFNLPDFEERRARLVAGLDKESTAVVDLFLRRLGERSIAFFLQFLVVPLCTIVFPNLLANIILLQVKQNAHVQICKSLL